jgi:TPR repeat protein
MAGLGIIYLKGRNGVSRDELAAVQWFKKAAEAGSALGMNNLGSMYDAGQGGVASDAEAIGWYRKAADKGYALAMRNLASHYAQGFLDNSKDSSK